MNEYPKYPSNDTQFEEVTIASVTPNSNGWGFTRSDGWSFHVGEDSPVVPAVGMSARFYGKGIGFIVRGLFLDGEKVFYRTEAEQDEYYQITTYGSNAQEWLNRWDAGQSVWSVSMGGFGPGYEQALQIAAVEVVRYMLGKNYDAAKWESSSEWEKCRNETSDAMMKHLEKLQLSGAQWGAALSLGAKIYRDGPRKVVKSAPEDRLIQVSNYFPTL